MSTNLEKTELMTDIETYKASGDGNLWDSILEKYLVPFQGTQDDCFKSNQKLLKNYPFYSVNGEAMPEVLPLCQDEQEIIYTLVGDRSFYHLRRWPLNPASLKKGAPVAISSRLWLKDLEECERRSAPDNVFMDAYTPFYLFYKPEEWALLLRLFDLKPLIDSNRAVFLVGTENIKKFFQENGAVFPESVIGEVNPCEHLNLIQEVYKDKVQQFETDIQEIKGYYSGNSAEIDRHFEEGKPKILFITSRFTTALQYHTRDSMLAAQRLGCETALLIEPDGLHRVDNAWEARIVAEFKPDAVYILDHFRYERDPKLYPEEIIFITWLQDLMAHITDISTPKKLNKRDFIMNFFITLKSFFEIGYKKEQIIEAPVPANPYIYHPHELSEDEWRKYGADICLVCHAADVDACMREMTDRFSSNPETQSIIIELYREYYRLARYKEVMYYSEAEFQSYVDKSLRRKYNIELSDASKTIIAEVVKHMKVFYAYTVFHRLVADWLIGAGFKNIKLWGRDWVKFPEYKSYAMGPAQNGETLSKIYQASKIVLGLNPGATGAARSWESMLSGTFYMSNYIPPEEDASDIRKILKVGENLVMFYNKKDLIKKVKYYLEHDEERREMARRGREVALQKMTYDALMKRVIGFIGDKLKERREERAPIDS